MRRNRLLVAAAMLGTLLVILVVLKFIGKGAGAGKPSVPKEEEEKPPPPVKLYRAKRTIVPGFIIDKTMIEEKEITQEEYQNLARQEENLITDEDEVVDYVVRYLIQEGDYIHSDDLWGSKESIGIEAQIPPGRIGYVLAGLTPPNPVSNKLLQVGNRVNLIATYAPNQLSNTIVEDALVVALGRFRGGEHPPPPTPPEEDASAEEKAEYEARLAEWQKEQEPDNITIAITPEDAERIAVSFKNATFDIVVQSGPQELVPSGPEEGERGILLTKSLRPGLTLDDIAPLERRDPETAEKKKEERRQADLERKRQEAAMKAQLAASREPIHVPPPKPELEIPPVPPPGPSREEVRAMVDQAVAAALAKKEREAGPVVVPPPSPPEKAEEKKVIEVFKGREKSEVEYTL